MRKRKERTTKERSETLICNSEEEREFVEEDEGKGFYACYLLCSLCPRFKGHTYIGYTVDPCRRIRQHNGEKTNGAVRTKRKRPWEMMLCIYGFPTNVSALQFEWAWQHPIESLAVRQAALSFKSLSGIANHVKLAYTMLSLPPWQSLKLTVNFFSTAYTKHAAGCPSLPKQMKVQVCSMDELPCYIGDSQVSDQIDDEEEWEHEDAGNGIGEISQSERSNDISVENSAVYQNTDYDWETLIESSVANPDIYHDWERLIEDDSLQQQKGSCRLREAEDNERPSRDIDSSPETLSTRIARLVNRRQLVEESYSYGLFAETGNKLGPTTKQILTSIVGASGNQAPPCYRYLCPPEVAFAETGEKLGPTTKQILTTIAGASGNQASPCYRYLSPPGVAFRQPKESLTSIEGARLPSFVTCFPLQTPSSSISRFVNTVQAIDGRDPSELIEESGSELGRASTQQTTTITSASEDHSPSKNSRHCPPEVCFREPMDLLSPGNKQGKFPSCVLDSPMEKPSSSVIEFPYGSILKGCGTKMKETIKQQLRTPAGYNYNQPTSSASTSCSSPEVQVINLLTPEGCVNKMKQANKQQLRTPAGYNYNQPTSSSSTSHSSPEVEVINLLTPSSDCNTHSLNSKKRRTLVHHDIVDLTRSPMFVQL
ncbi:hypothetical protein MKW98_010222 [Papaver atlanticum]|uniref:Structure-specific endonuclease subunit SLX1 homolog n=1 Tax=Papaver atlanticum TaxID=357466 RepID=A0AAD4SMQ0_9MAGN|nr:hypothetical protein MKW98_010222 [Papaver atlanticum]